MKQSMEKEALRQVYLREMGIQVWFPRFTLPHTDTVREYEYDCLSVPPQAASTAVESTEPARTDAAAQSDSSVQQYQSAQIDSTESNSHERLKAGLLADSNQKQQQSPLIEDPRQQKSQQTIPQQNTEAAALPGEELSGEGSAAHPVQFAFAYLAVSDSLAVICEIPYQNRGRLQAPIRSLLARILEALSVQVRPGSTPVIHFHWPLYEAQQQPTHSNQPENELLDQGIESARQTLHAFLARQLNDRPAPFLLIFSEHWPHYLFPADFTPADAQGLFTHPQFSTQVLLTRGLHIMQADDSIKKPVWQQLQVLKTQIKQLKNATAQTTDSSTDSHHDSGHAAKK